VQSEPRSLTSIVRKEVTSSNLSVQSEARSITPIVGKEATSSSNLSVQSEPRSLTSIVRKEVTSSNLSVQSEARSVTPFVGKEVTSSVSDLSKNQAIYGVSKGESGSVVEPKKKSDECENSREVEKVSEFRRVMDEGKSGWLRQKKPKPVSPPPKFDLGRSEGRVVSEAVGVERGEEEKVVGVKRNDRIMVKSSMAIKKLLLMWDEIYSENDFEKIS
jgi:hypothetical protein